MTILIRNGRVATDAFVSVADDTDLPLDQPIIVSLARWAKDGETLRARAFGVSLPNTVDVRMLDSALLQAALIVLQFPSFSDGRGYSQARLLREVFEYRGEVRATGAAVVRDQVLGMARCGIDAFELRADQSAASCLEALHEFSIAYQPGVANDPLPQVRRSRRLEAR